MLIRFIFNESLALVKNNITIIAPTVLVSLISLIISSATIGNSLDLSAAHTPEEMLTMLQGVFGKILTLSIINYFLQALAHAVSIVLVREAYFKKPVSIDVAFLFTMRKIGTLFFASIITGILLFLGVFLFLVPSVLVSYFFMFTFVIILNEDLSAIESIKRSIYLVRTNILNTIMFYVHLLMLAMTVMLVSMTLAGVDRLGVVASTLVNGLYMTFVAACIMRYYIELRRVEIKT
ncbi:MAG: hypothetical protein HQL06_12625 [Nitrospirae bacterium]|nr:hypothetical protein [Nitrospirota bacterium]